MHTVGTHVCSFVEVWFQEVDLHMNPIEYQVTEWVQVHVVFGGCRQVPYQFHQVLDSFTYLRSTQLNAFNISVSVLNCTIPNCTVIQLYTHT